MATEGAKESQQRVATEPKPVTTTTNPTNSRVLATKPQTHLRITRANKPGTTAPIATPDATNRRSIRLNPEEMMVEEATTPNSNRIPLYHPNMIS